MRKLLYAVVFWLQVLPLWAQELPADARAVLENAVTVGRQAEEVLAQYPVAPPAPAVVTVPAGGDLQAALNQGGRIALTSGAVYVSSGFVITQSGTTLYGNGAHLTGTTGPALRVPPGVNDVVVQDLTGGSDFQTVYQLGDNLASTQSTLESVPRRIVFRNVSVPTHRGKRAFEVNAADVELLYCNAADTFSPAGADSQAIGVLNTPGPVLVDGGRFSAGSEVIMVGGDSMKIPGVIPSDLTFRNLELYRPLSWRTDGVRRYVKNLFELKTGRRVRVENVVMDGSWTDAQVSFAIVLTPRQGGVIENVTFDNLVVTNVGGGINLLGESTASAGRTTGVVVRNSFFNIRKEDFGGYGVLALLTSGPGTLDIENTRVTNDDYYGRLILLGDRLPVEAVRLRGNRIMTRYYRSTANIIGTPDGTHTFFGEVVVEGNTIGDASTRTKAWFPNNTYLTRAEFDALPN